MDAEILLLEKPKLHPPEIYQENFFTQPFQKNSFKFESMKSKIINSANIIKSPLRYPGGKSRAVRKIIPFIPEFDEFRDPMVGGGSIVFAIKQIFPDKKYWINDINTELFHFWGHCKENISPLLKVVEDLKQKHYRNGKKLYKYMKSLNTKELNSFQRAVRFYILNRITFSGLAESGGFSKESFYNRFNKSCLNRLKLSSEVLKKVTITNKDYEELLFKPGKNVFIFLDPPYFSKTDSKLYGKNGDIHEKFNHERFAELMKKCPHKWIITYDDSPKIRKLYSFAHITPWELQYGMNNYKQKTAAKGKELFISNFILSNSENLEMQK